MQPCRPRRGYVGWAKSCVTDRWKHDSSWWSYHGELWYVCIRIVRLYYL